MELRRIGFIYGYNQKTLQVGRNYTEALSMGKQNLAEKPLHGVIRSS